MEYLEGFDEHELSNSIKTHKLYPVKAFGPECVPFFMYLIHMSGSIMIVKSVATLFFFIAHKEKIAVSALLLKVLCRKTLIGTSYT